MGLSACLAAVLLAIFGHIALYTYLKRQNKKRDNMTAEERAVEIAKGKIGDYHPDFRYAL